MIYGKSLLLTFQKRHHKIALEKLSKNRTIVKSRWPNLDVIYEPLEFNAVDKWNDAILIGFHGWAGRDSVYYPGFEVFNKIWYKIYTPSWAINMPLLPEQFVGPKGSKYCAEACKFILTSGSGCYQDVLLFGSIPIMLPDNIVKEEPLDDIVSRVNFKVWRGEVTPFKCITMKNIKFKIDLLRNDINLFEKIQKELFSEWFDEDYFSFPPAHEVIYNFIKENG